MSIASTALLHPNVHLGNNVTIEDFAIIGAVPRGHCDGELPTIIGDNAVIRSHSVIYAGNTFGNDFQCGNHVFLREANNIGSQVSIGTATVIEHHVTVGNKVRIHSQVFIPEYSILEDDCWLGPNVVLTNAKHPKCPKVKQCLKGATIGKGAIIGANATLMPDIEIGSRALIGAGSVVVSDIEPGVVAAGNPAIVIKGISELACPYGLIDRPYTE
jgi:acetyltransferase-like isoleucine patch superfamily enzyme